MTSRLDVIEQEVEATPLPRRMRALADEIMAPLVCTKPAYGAPGSAHCAACCYGTGYVVTCAEDQAMVDAAVALRSAALLAEETT